MGVIRKRDFHSEASSLARVVKVKGSGSSRNENRASDILLFASRVLKNLKQISNIVPIVEESEESSGAQPLICDRSVRPHPVQKFRREKSAGNSGERQKFPAIETKHTLNFQLDRCQANCEVSTIVFSLFISNIS